MASTFQVLARFHVVEPTLIALITVIITGMLCNVINYYIYPIIIIIIMNNLLLLL